MSIDLLGMGEGLAIDASLEEGQVCVGGEGGVHVGEGIQGIVKLVWMGEGMKKLVIKIWSSRNSMGGALSTDLLLKGTMAADIIIIISIIIMGIMMMMMIGMMEGG